MAIIFGIINAIQVLNIGINQVSAEDDESMNIRRAIPQRKLEQMVEIAELISDGSDTFLKTEYFSIGIFTVIFALIIAFVVEKEEGTYYATCSFLLGAVTSIISGYIGMWISVRANVRTTKMSNNSLE